jgi:hypothetical protein
MLASPVPIYLGCASLIVGTLGLGAQHLLGGSSGPSTNKDTAMEQPLFARSVEQASLPTTQWPSKNVDVAYYGPMVELMTQPTASVPAPLADPSRVAVPQGTPPEATQGQQPSARDVAPAPQSPSTTAQVQEQPRAAPREVVRDLSPQQSKQSRRARHQRQRDDARTGGETASTEQVDPREARTQETRNQERQRTATRVDTERRDGRRSERRYRDRNDVDEVDARTRSDRRGREFEDRRPRDGERRVVVREETREPEQRVVRGPEQRGLEQRDVGFSPFRLFGIFEQR